MNDPKITLTGSGEFSELFPKEGIEVAPVRRGKWEVSKDGDWCTCSECHADLDISIGTGCFVDGEELELPKYCPNCGAKMDAERKEKITTEAALDAWQRIRNMFKNGDASYVVLLNPRLIDAAIDALKKQTEEAKEE